MKARLLSTCALWTIILAACFYLGFTGATLLIVVFSAATQWELYRLMEKADRGPQPIVGTLCGVFLVLGSHYGQSIGLSPAAMLSLAVIVCSVAALFGSHELPFSRRLSATLFGLVLVPFFMSFFFELVRLGGLAAGVWVLAVAKFTDAGALLFGMAFGRTPLAPRISPRKTVEGLAGGVLVGVSVSWLVAYLAHSQFGLLPAQFQGWPVALLAIPVSLASGLSDLLASALKREAGAKDSGHTIPGIGGVLDLTDSLLLSAPIAAKLLSFYLLTTS